MSNNTTFLTQDGIRKLEEKLEYLKSVRRQEVAARIKSAIALGDLSENSEYEDAKNEQAFLEGEILSTENILRSAEVVEDAPASSDTVTMGSTVKVKDLSADRETSYTIVGSDEADPFSGKISNASPIGAALIGHAQGDTVDFNAPNGNRKLRILDVEHK